MNNAARCSTTLCGPPAAGIEFWNFSKDLGSSIMRFHGTRFETMAILVKALKCATKRFRAFP